MQKIKVIIVDDHPMVLEGMRAMLSQLNFIDLAGTAANAFDAMGLLKKTLPDVAIVDINLPDVSGIELTAKIKKEIPQVKVLAMSTFKERSYISQMIQNGASGYLVKSASKEEIENAILTAYEGKLYLSLDLNSLQFDKSSLPEIPILSSREKEVLQLIADGLTNPQIAEKLFISMHTVDSHRKNLLAKFNVNNTAALVKMAVKYNMV
ncbi:MAG: response regulator transcription factor [Chitinophagaceae bacterium]|nr:response regulator transcription factor [Chitinophagaceae bacterium]